MLRILVKAQMQSVLASLVRSKKGKNASLLAAVLLLYQVRKFRHRPHAERSI